MKRSYGRAVAILLSLPLFLGGGSADPSIHISQPLSGELTAGSSQQPSGTASNYQITDNVIVAKLNWGTGFYNSGTYNCDEWWKGEDWTNDGWCTENSFTFDGPGLWQLTATLWRNGEALANNMRSGSVVVE